MQKVKIAEEKRKLQDEMKRKKEEMMSKFEKLLKKGKLMSKEDFYKQIFNENYSPFASKEFAGGSEYNLSENMEREDTYKPEEKEENTFVTAKKDETFSKHELNTSVNKKDKIPSKQVSTKIIEHVKPEPVKEESVKYLSVEEIKEKVSERKSELEHSLLDAITKFEIEEKKLLEEIKEEDTEEEKQAKHEIYSEEKNKNEQKVSHLRE
jgi:hypothetical protein